MTSTANPDGPAPKRADAVANRQRLLQAARAAFAELGANAEVKDIAERAGIGVGTIYRHFDSKEDLLREVISEAMADFHRDLEGLAELPDPVDAIRTFLAATLGVTEVYGWLFDAMLAGNLPEGVQEGLDKHDAAVPLEAVLMRGMDTGVFAADLDLPIAMNMLFGFTLTWKYGDLNQTMTPGEAVERTLRLFLRGASGSR